jgi:hypothetical protein
MQTDGLLGLSQASGGGAVGRNRADVEDGQEAETVQLGRDVLLFRVGVQAVWRRRAMLGACSAGRTRAGRLPGLPLRR